jgi:hypothetical protein
VRRIDLDLDETLAPVVLDPARVAQVIGNLIANALLLSNGDLLVGASAKRLREPARTSCRLLGSCNAYTRCMASAPQSHAEIIELLTRRQDRLEERVNQLEAELRALADKVAEEELAASERVEAG